MPPTATFEDIKAHQEKVDNAKIYHANGLKAACYRLNIKLLQQPPKDPPIGGLIARFFF